MPVPDGTDPEEGQTPEVVAHDIENEEVPCGALDPCHLFSPA